MGSKRKHALFTIFIGLAGTVPLSGCSGLNQTPISEKNNSVHRHVENSDSTTNKAQDNSSNAQPSSSRAEPPVLQSFNEAKDWYHPYSSAYSPGLVTVKEPLFPTAFEESVRPQEGVAGIYISRRASTNGESVLFQNGWTQKIQYSDYSFEINGQKYTVPKAYRKKNILVLPMDHGIVWSPVGSLPNNQSQVLRDLSGSASIYYTPYQAHGGPLTNGKQLIAQLPHRWMGIDGPVISSAWTGWLPQNHVTMSHLVSETSYQLQFDNNNNLKSATPLNKAIPGWPTLFMHNLNKPSYYQKPHYAAFVGSLTRTCNGFVLGVMFMDATQSGRNAGVSSASYYWSELTRKWTPLNQNFTVQTLSSWTDVGSGGVYWVQPSPIGDGSGNELDVTEMHFDPGTLSIQSIWLGNWFYGPSFVSGNSWVAVLPNEMPTSGSGIPKQWTVYTP